MRVSTSETQALRQSNQPIRIDWEEGGEGGNKTESGWKEEGVDMMVAGRQVSALVHENLRLQSVLHQVRQRHPPCGPQCTTSTLC